MASRDVRRISSKGPFRADQIRAGDPYELSEGHPITCLPSGGRGARASGTGFVSLDTDPEADAAGFDAGFTPAPDTLRAPDIAVGNVPDAPGWAPGVPPLAVEYADTGQDEPDLQKKISELLAAGTRHVWVVRLVGPRRVEVYEPGAPMRTVLPGHELRAPGVLRNPVPVEALYDREVAHEVALRNLLQRRGYDSLEAVHEEGREEGRQEGRVVEARAALRRVLARRKLALTPADEARIEACGDLRRLEAWHDQAIDAPSAADALR
jgi:hypothetical protein